MFSKTKLFSIATDGTVDMQLVEGVKIAGRPAVRVHVNEDTHPTQGAEILRQIADHSETVHADNLHEVETVNG